VLIKHSCADHLLQEQQNVSNTAISSIATQTEPHLLPQQQQSSKMLNQIISLRHKKHITN
jgi:hypothetical protein